MFVLGGWPSVFFGWKVLTYRLWINGGICTQHCDLAVWKFCAHVTEVVIIPFVRTNDCIVHAVKEVETCSFCSVSGCWHAEFYYGSEAPVSPCFFLDFQRFEALKNFFISRPVLTLPSAGLSSKGDPKSEGSEVGWANLWIGKKNNETYEIM